LSHQISNIGKLRLDMSNSECFEDANDQLEKIDLFCRTLPEVLAVRVAIYRGLKKMEVDAVNRQTAQGV